jgi:hypothetical protein
MSAVKASFGCRRERVNFDTFFSIYRFKDKQKLPTQYLKESCENRNRARGVGGGFLLLAACTVGYKEFDFFLENKEYRPFDGCKIEI